MYNEKYMNLAVDTAREGIDKGCGGPFGCVIVKHGEVVAIGHNEVVSNNDPTAHGEIVAIRKACEELGTFDLSGCELYTTGEPCPMCLSAIMWARIDIVYYAMTIDDAADIGFDDRPFYKRMYDYCIGEDTKAFYIIEEKSNKNAVDLFTDYMNKDNKTMY